MRARTFRDMLRMLGAINPRLGKMAASGDAEAFQAALSDAIAVHLSTMTTGQGLDALIEDVK